MESRKGNDIYIESSERSETVREDIYYFLIDYFTENGYAPSVQEIADAVGLNSKSTVCSHLETLELLGKIHVERGKSRAIKIMDYKFVKAK